MLARPPSWRLARANRNANTFPPQPAASGTANTGCPAASLGGCRLVIGLRDIGTLHVVEPQRCCSPWSWSSPPAASRGTSSFAVTCYCADSGCVGAQDRSRGDRPLLPAGAPCPTYTFWVPTRPSVHRAPRRTTLGRQPLPAAGLAAFLTGDPDEPLRVKATTSRQRRSSRRCGLGSSHFFSAPTHRITLRK